MSLGAHVSISDGIITGGKSVKKAGGNIIQIFLTSPRRTLISPKSQEELNKINIELKKLNIQTVVHSSYLLNIAMNWDKNSWWIKNLITELEYCYYLDSQGLVIHLGKQLDLSQSDAYNNMYTSLIYVISQTVNTPTKILIETSSGQGSEMCYKLNDLAFFYNKILKHPLLSNRIGICVDTCHVHAAEYNLKNIKTIKTYFEEFNKLIGIKHIKLIHLNDSKKESKSKIDRHENIGKGTIGTQSIKYIYKLGIKYNIPMILETPSMGYLSEIPLLKSKK